MAMSTFHPVQANSRISVSRVATLTRGVIVQSKGAGCLEQDQPTLMLAGTKAGRNGWDVHQSGVHGELLVDDGWLIMTIERWVYVERLEH